MFDELNPILHSQLRLAIVSLLIGVEQAEFTYLQEKTNATSGNLSVQIKKLSEVGYIHIEKGYKDNFPQTLCSITPKGVEEFEKYVSVLQQYIHAGPSK